MCCQIDSIKNREFFFWNLTYEFIGSRNFELQGFTLTFLRKHIFIIHY